MARDSKNELGWLHIGLKISSRRREKWSRVGRGESSLSYIDFRGGGGQGK